MYRMLPKHSMNLSAFIVYKFMQTYSDIIMIIIREKCQYHPSKSRSNPSHFYILNPNDLASYITAPTSSNLLSSTPKSFNVAFLSLTLYQAILANQPSGHFLTQNFLASSVKSIHIPKANGKKKYSTGIGLLLIADANPGM